MFPSEHTPPPLLNEMNWYYCTDGSTIEGPVSEQSLSALKSSGLLAGNTFIMRQGETTWTTYREVFENSEPFGGSEPHTPSTSTGDPGEASLDEWVNGRMKRTKRVWTGVLVALMIGIVGSVVVRKAHKEAAAREFRERVLANRENQSSSLSSSTRTCRKCDGTGQIMTPYSARPTGGLHGLGEDDCTVCRGQGTIYTPSGFQAVCQTCGGRGVKPTTSCSLCGGTGRVAR